MARLGSLTGPSPRPDGLGTSTSASRGWPGWTRHIVGGVISVACIGFIATQVSLADLAAAFEQFQWPFLLLGLLSLSAGYVARIVRWWVMLRAGGAAVTAGQCAAPFLASIALNNVLPLRLGDVIRALVFPASIGVTRTIATSSIVLERLVDMTTLLAALALGLAANDRISLPTWLRGTAITLAVVGGSTLVIGVMASGRLANWCFRAAGPVVSVEETRRHKAFTAVGNLLLGFAEMSRIGVLAVLLILSAVVWIGEAGLFLFLLIGFGFETSLSMAVVVMAVATLSTLVPSSPGYIGPFHLAAYTAIAAVGGSPAQAGSFAVLAHLGVWLPTTLAGAIAILMKPGLFPGPKRIGSLTRPSGTRD